MKAMVVKKNFLFSGSERLVPVEPFFCTGLVIGLLVTSLASSRSGR
jgi:hypothetical protein